MMRWAHSNHYYQFNDENEWRVKCDWLIHEILTNRKFTRGHCIKWILSSKKKIHHATQILYDFTTKYQKHVDEN